MPNKSIKIDVVLLGRSDVRHSTKNLFEPIKMFQEIEEHNKIDNYGISPLLYIPQSKCVDLVRKHRNKIPNSTLNYLFKELELDIFYFFADLIANEFDSNGGQYKFLGGNDQDFIDVMLKCSINKRHDISLLLNESYKSPNRVVTSLAFKYLSKDEFQTIGSIYGWIDWSVYKPMNKRTSYATLLSITSKFVERKGMKLLQDHFKVNAVRLLEQFWNNRVYITHN